MTVDQDVRNLEFMLLSKEKEVENSMSEIQDGEESRRRTRKEILKRELEVLMLALNMQDNDMTRRVRGQILHALFNYKKAATNLLKEIKESENDKIISPKLKEFHEVIDKMDDLCKIAELEIESDIAGLRESFGRHIFVKPKMISPQNYKMYVRPFPEKRVRAVIVANSTEAFRNEIVLSAMDIEYTALAASHQSDPTFPIFKANLGDLMKKKNSVARLKTETCIEIDLPPSPTCQGRVEVKLFGLSIQDGGSKSFSVLTTPQGNISLFNPEDKTDDTATSENSLLSAAKAAFSKQQVESESISNQLDTPAGHPADIVAVPNILNISTSQSLDVGCPSPLPVVEKFLTQTSSHRLGEADLNDWEPHGGQGVKDADPLDESCAMALGISCNACPDASCIDVTAFVQQRWNDLVEGDNYILCLNESAVIDILKQPEPPTGDSSPVCLHQSQLGQNLHDEDANVDQAESPEKSVHQSVMNQSVYEVRTLTYCSDFWKDRSIWEPVKKETEVRFSADKFVEINEDPSRVLGKSCYRTLKCLECPGFMAVETSRQYLFISEPNKDRIGIYDVSNLSFKCWFNIPTTRPKQIVCVDADIMAVAVARGVDVFQATLDTFSLCQTISGKFRGLVCVDKRIYTTEVIGNSCKIRGFEMDQSGFYAASFSSQITCIEDWSTGTLNPQDLAVKDMVFYISDPGKARVYVINIKTGVQSAEGYYGDSTGRWKRPMGLCVDDVGNILVADSELNKLIVLSKNKIVVREISLGSKLTWRQHPVGLLRYEDTVIIAFRGTSDGGIVRFKLCPQENKLPKIHLPVQH